MQSKASIRKAIRNELNRLSAFEISRKSGLIASLVCKTAAWDTAGLVCLYLSFGHEVDTAALVQQARLEHKLWAAPRITGDQLIFYDCTQQKLDFTSNSYGIREPETTAPCIDLHHFDKPSLFIIPGLAFDKQKNRLGRGKGYYDRYLASLEQLIQAGSITRQVTLLGICFAEQLLSAVPVTPLDKSVNLVITDKGSII